MSQLFQQLNPQSLNVKSQPNNPIVNLYNKVKFMSNPMGYLNNLPGVKDVMGLINQNGGNAKQVFYQLAQQKGVDPNSILDMFK